MENYKKQKSEGSNTKNMVSFAKNPGFAYHLCSFLGDDPEQIT